MKKTILILSALIFATMFLIGQSCLPEGITFTTQAQIDSFQINYPGCTEIEGDVSIVDTDITNLNGLSVLTSIGGKITIWDNASLTSLTGLEGLTSIGGGLRISTNNALTSLTALQGVNSINGNLMINGNTVLTSLEGLESIEAGSIEDLRILRNPQISNCELQNLCDYLISPMGAVSIYDNDIGCNNPAEVASACGFIIPCLPFGNYHFHSQAELDNFQSDYPDCTDLEGYVHIEGYDITNLYGLEMVSSINSLWIFNNDMLTNLDGLEALAYIGHLHIVYNDTLSNCEVESICAYLESPNGAISIHDNAIGCNSPNEVRDSCEANAVNIDEQFTKDYLMLYPNPSSGKLTLRYSILNPRSLILEMYSIEGVKVMTLLDQIQQAGEHKMTFDISHLPAGMYFARMQIGKNVETVKIVKVGSRQ